ncbi:MAG: CS1-pili formation C-terminal domain-containing protein, partial [Hyphomonas sp.]
DEVRTFTRSLNMPPKGETVYSVRAGVRALDNLTSVEEDMQASGLFPETTSETIVSAAASRRISDAASATVGLTAVGGDLFPEAELQWYRGLFRTSAALAVGPDGQYAASAAVNFQVGSVSGALSARKTSGADHERTDLYDPRAYRPFLQSEENIFGSLQTRLYGGSLGLRASLSRSELSEERYTVGLNYSRSLRKTFFGNGFITAEAVTTDSETRVGIRFSVQNRLGRSATLNTMAGGDIFQPRTDLIDRNGFFPAARMTYSRAGQLGDGSYSTSMSAGTAGGDSNATFNAGAGTSLGVFDGSVGVSKLRDSSATEAFATGNALTGFVIGGGEFKFGSAGYGDAAILLNIESDNQGNAQGGRYRILLDNQQSDIVRVGGSASQIVPAFTRTLVGLVPIDAPAFDIDLTPQEVPLYPGNVVRLAWKAVYVTAAFGRLLDHEDIPVPNAFVRSENGDQSVTSDQGYFSITAPLGAPITIRRADGSECATLRIGDDNRGHKNESILRLGNVYCQIPEKTDSPSTRTDDPAPLIPDHNTGLKLSEVAMEINPKQLLQARSSAMRVSRRIKDIREYTSHQSDI